jgi:hypothetical protein
MEAEEGAEWTVVRKISATNIVCKTATGTGTASHVASRHHHNNKPKNALYSTNECLLTDGPSSAKSRDVNAVVTSNKLSWFMPRAAIFNHTIAYISISSNSHGGKDDSVTCIVSLSLGDGLSD